MSSQKILVVDDHEDLRTLIKLFLESRGYNVLEAASGAEAIRKAITADPKFILLDLRLPDMSGLEVVRVLRTVSLTAHVPIVGWTDYVSQSHRETLLRTGLIDCLQKSVSFSELGPERWFGGEELEVTAPVVDMFEEKDQIVVNAEIPGIEKNNIEVNLSDHMLTIKDTADPGRPTQNAFRHGLAGVPQRRK
jgi:CheY-like chemotaxis protein